MAVAFAPGGKTLATAGNDKLVYIWEAATGKKQKTLEGHPSAVTALAWIPTTARRMAAAAAQQSSGLEMGLIKLWDTDGWKERPASRFAVAPIFALAFTDEGKTLITAAKDNAVQFWDVDKGQERTSLKGHLGWVRSLAVVRGGQVVVAYGQR